MNIDFNQFTLKNGLKVLVHERTDTQLASLNILYNVGARNESPERTGFAHLFEHLMFEGSVNVPAYDKPLQQVGGDNNAFTTNDITNYYLTLPAGNIETGFWLESDRMLSLAFTQERLEVQRKVVVEEFRQRYLNQPYGDVMHILRPLIYKKHPYRWPTVGIEPSHIENATLKDVKDFFFSWYAPNNAILTVAGNVKTKEIEKLAQKWFGPIEKRNLIKINIPEEPVQKEYRKLTVKKDVPYDALFMAFKMPGRLHPEFHSCDLLSDILGNSRSSRLWKKLAVKKPVFSDISSYISGSNDTGFILIEGYLNSNVKITDAENEVWKVIEELRTGKISARETGKVVNKAESTTLFHTMGVAQISLTLAIYESLGDASLINKEHLNYRAVTEDKIVTAANKYLTRKNACVLHYLKK